MRSVDKSIEAGGKQADQTYDVILSFAKSKNSDRDKKEK